MNILFYDGTCRFCDRFVHLGLRHDRRGVWRYSPLQSEFAARELARYNVDAAALDSIHVILHYGTGEERLLRSSDAGLAFWRSLAAQISESNIIYLRGSQYWIKLTAGLLGIVPHFIREPMYRLLARNRYRWFGRYETCKVPDPEQHALFIEE